MLEQTYRHWELLLIDDGSTDDSAEICDSEALNDERIIVVHKKNGGEASSRNCGIQFASGDYLHVIDQDDTFDTGMYEDAMKYAKHSPDIIKGGYTIHSGQSQKDILNSHPTNVMLNRQYVIREMIPYTIETCIDEKKKFSGHWSMLSRLSLVKAKGLCYDEALPKMNDSKFMVDLLAVTNSVVFLDKCYYHWIRRSGSLTSHYSKMFDGIAEVADYYESLFSGKEYGYDFYSQDKLRHNVAFTFDSLDLVIIHWKTINILNEMKRIFKDEHCKKWFAKLEPYDAFTVRLKSYIDNGHFHLAVMDYLFFFFFSHVKRKLIKS